MQQHYEQFPAVAFVFMDAMLNGSVAIKKLFCSRVPLGRHRKCRRNSITCGDGKSRRM
jgi:hypothetical protein